MCPYPCCHEVTHSCVGTKPFRPTAVAARLSRLPVISTDIALLALIFPLAFSDSSLVPRGWCSDSVGDINGIVAAPSSSEFARTFSGDPQFDG